MPLSFLDTLVAYIKSNISLVDSPIVLVHVPYVLKVSILALVLSITFANLVIRVSCNIMHMISPFLMIRSVSLMPLKESTMDFPVVDGPTWA